MKDFEQIILLLQNYKERNGDCLVPHSYITDAGIKLGCIVNSIRTGKRKTSEEEKAKLDGIGFVWKVRESSLSFKEVLRLLQNYKEQTGNCLVPWNYITEDGIKLGKIVSKIRTGNKKTSEDEKAKLDSLGFVWKVTESSLSFKEVLSLLQNYKEQTGNCLVPQSYITEDGIKLGKIVSNIRCGSRKTSEDEKAKLDSLGFVWKVRESSLSFKEVLSLLQNYKKQTGNCLVPQSYITEDGIELGQIVSNIRSGSRKTSEEEKAKLDGIDFVWKVRESSLSFKEVLSLLQNYKEQTGNCLVPQSYITKDGIKLGLIVSSIRSGNRKISEDQKAMLDGLGFVWRVK